jgi:hypothetical protein
MRRWGDTYLTLDEGIAGVADFNYVEGFQLGTTGTLGFFTPSHRRWEVTPLLRYGFSSERWQEELTVRYYAPVEREAWLELSCGDRTTDFNPQPQLAHGQAAIAMSIFAWDHPKFYHLRHLTARGSTAVGDEVILTGTLSWQQREARPNSRWRSFFGSRVTQNDLPWPEGTTSATGVNPGAGLTSRSDSAWYFPTTEVLKLRADVAYTPGRRLLVLNDMEARSLSRYPTLTAGVEVTADVPRAHRSLADLRRRERWELGVEQTLRTTAGRLQYRAEVGTFTGQRDGQLMDYRHFEASRFGWQRQDPVTWFTLLDDYRLSTDRSWALLCSRLEGQRLLLSRLCGRRWPREVTERVGLRLLKVTSAPLHTELEYGWDFSRLLSLGASVAFADGAYDGVGVRLVIRY